MITVILLLLCLCTIIILHTDNILYKNILKAIDLLEGGCHSPSRKHAVFFSV